MKRVRFPAILLAFTFLLTALSASGGTNPFGFTGHEYDSETGLYYMKGRYYDPETGRFLTPDASSCGRLNLRSHDPPSIHLRYRQSNLIR